MTVLRRFDCVLESTKAEVVKRFHQLEGGKVRNIDPILNKVAGGGEDLGFHNHSELDFRRLKGDPDHMGRHLTRYMDGFSENVRRIFERFEFEKEIEKLEEVNRLYLVVAKVAAGGMWRYRRFERWHVRKRLQKRRQGASPLHPQGSNAPSIKEPHRPPRTGQTEVVAVLLYTSMPPS
jgi:hypothetical protein